MNDRLGFHCNRMANFDATIIENGLARGEFYNFPKGELPELKRAVLRHNLRSSIHSPLVRPEWYPEPPTWSFLCDVDDERRNMTLEMVRQTMEMASDFGAEYVVVHFPVPPSQKTDGVSYARLRDFCLRSSEALAQLAEKWRLPIHIEGFGPSPFLNMPFLSQIFAEHKNLKYCFDSGHMHLTSIRDRIDLYRFAEDIAPHLGSMHLWNGRTFDDYFTYRHIPVHPSQNPADGWADIERLLRIALERNHDCRLIFESGLHYPASLGGYDLRDGVTWVKEIVTTLS